MHLTLFSTLDEASWLVPPFSTLVLPLVEASWLLPHFSLVKEFAPQSPSIPGKKQNSAYWRPFKGELVALGFHLGNNRSKGSLPREA